MAFITGVDLEAKIASEETALALAIAKKRPPRRRRKQLELEDGGWQAKALCDQPKAVDYNQLLKTTEQLKGSEDPLEELRRRIKRTRSKMDSQNQVMDGFLNDVRQMQHMDKSFSSAELSTPSSPAGALALTNGAGSKVPALTNGSGAKALCSGPNSLEQGQHPRALGPRPSSASNSRGLSLRSDVPSRRLGESRSQPALTAAAKAAVGGLHQATPLTLPARRAPPGAPGSELQKAISSAAAARRSAIAATASGDALGTGVRIGATRKSSSRGL